MSNRVPVWWAVADRKLFYLFFLSLFSFFNVLFFLNFFFCLSFGLFLFLFLFNISHVESVTFSFYLQMGHPKAKNTPPPKKKLFLFTDTKTDRRKHKVTSIDRSCFQLQNAMFPQSPRQHNSRKQKCFLASVYQFHLLTYSQNTLKNNLYESSSSSSCADRTEPLEPHLATHPYWPSLLVSPLNGTPVSVQRGRVVPIYPPITHEQDATLGRFWVEFNWFEFWVFLLYWLP